MSESKLQKQISESKVYQEATNIAQDLVKHKVDWENSLREDSW